MIHGIALKWFKTKHPSTNPYILNPAAVPNSPDHRSTCLPSSHVRRHLGCSMWGWTLVGWLHKNLFGDEAGAMGHKSRFRYPIAILPWKKNMKKCSIKRTWWSQTLIRCCPPHDFLDFVLRFLGRSQLPSSESGDFFAALALTLALALAFAFALGVLLPGSGFSTLEARAVRRTVLVPLGQV